MPQTDLKCSEERHASAQFQNRKEAFQGVIANVAEKLKHGRKIRFQPKPEPYVLALKTNEQSIRSNPRQRPRLHSAEFLLFLPAGIPRN